MMFCPKCGKENPDTAKFCGGCGASLPQRAATPSGAAAQPGAASQPAPGTAPAPATTGGVRWSAPRSTFALLSKQTKIVLAVAAVVLAALVVFGITRCSNNPHATADALARSVTGVYERLFTGGYSQDKVERAASDLLDLMPPGALDKAIEMGDYDNRQELVEDAADSVSDMYDSMGVVDVMDKVKVKIEITEGEQLDQDDLDDINEFFHDANLGIEATDGVKLGMDGSITFLDDYVIYEKGETVDQSLESIGISAIKVDGKWYLWTGSFSL